MIGGQVNGVAVIWRLVPASSLALAFCLTALGCSGAAIHTEGAPTDVPTESVLTTPASSPSPTTTPASVPSPTVKVVRGLIQEHPGQPGEATQSPQPPPQSNTPKPTEAFPRASTCDLTRGSRVRFGDEEILLSDALCVVTVEEGVVGIQAAGGRSWIAVRQLHGQLVGGALYVEELDLWEHFEPFIGTGVPGRLSVLPTPTATAPPEPSPVSSPPPKPSSIATSAPTPSPTPSPSPSPTSTSVVPPTPSPTASLLPAPSPSPTATPSPYPPACAGIGTPEHTGSYLSARTSLLRRNRLHHVTYHPWEGSDVEGPDRSKRGVQHHRQVQIGTQQG